MNNNNNDNNNFNCVSFNSTQSVSVSFRLFALALVRAKLRPLLFGRARSLCKPVRALPYSLSHLELKGGGELRPEPLVWDKN